MIANNLLEIYTLIFAWNMYEAVWDVLSGTGLALIPFIAVLISNIRDNYTQSDAMVRVRSLEKSILGMALILLLCVVPYKGWNLNMSTVQYTLEIPDCHPPSNVQGRGDNTTTAFDETFQDMQGLDIHKPILWALVETISTAITHTAIKSMSCVNNYEFMLTRVAQVSVQDPVLKERIADFTKVCYSKALDRFSENPLVLPSNTIEVDNIDWIGSRILLNNQNEYYDHSEAYMTNMQQYGFQRASNQRDSDAASESGANPSCKEIWLGEDVGNGTNSQLGLRHLLLEDIPLDDVGDIVNDWKTWGSNVVTIGAVSNEVKEDLLLKMVLQSNAAQLHSTLSLDLSNNFDVDQSMWKNALDTVSSISGSVSGMNEFFRAHTVKQMARIAGPMALAFIQMIVILSAPFVLLFGGYKATSFLSLGITYFALEFTNAIWAITFWFDNRILDLYASQDGWIDGTLTSFLVSAVSAGSIVVLPLIWLSIMSIAGSSLLRGLGNSMGPGSSQNPSYTPVNMAQQAKKGYESSKSSKRT